MGADRQLATPHRAHFYRSGVRGLSAIDTVQARWQFPLASGCADDGVCARQSAGRDHQHRLLQRRQRHRPAAGHLRRQHQLPDDLPVSVVYLLPGLPHAAAAPQHHRTHQRRHPGRLKLSRPGPVPRISGSQHQRRQHPPATATAIAQTHRSGCFF
jgi:hypothetical protein